MVEQDAAAAKDAVGLTVVDGNPVRVQLGNAVGTARIERRVLLLRHGLHLAEHLRRGCLVEPDLGIDDADRLQQVKCADA